MNKSGKTVREEVGMMAAAAMMIIMCASREKKAHEKKVSQSKDSLLTHHQHTRARALSAAVPAQTQLVLHVSPELEGGWLQS